MPATLYILRSVATGAYYTGIARDLEMRLGQHQGDIPNPSQWTRSRGPWELAYQRQFQTVTAALRAEKFIKRMKSRRFIEQLIHGEHNLDQFDSSRESG